MTWVMEYPALAMTVGGMAIFGIGFLIVVFVMGDGDD